MILLPAHPDDVALAIEESRSLGALNHSILEGKGNKTGLLGELTVIRFLGDKSKRANTYDYDLMIDGRRFDVKTKRRTVDPQPNYHCAIPEYQLFQECDFYLFISVRVNQRLPFTVSLCGWISKEDFVRKAKKVCAGERDESNGWICSKDCRVMFYSELKHVDLLKNSQLEGLCTPSPPPLRAAES